MWSMFWRRFCIQTSHRSRISRSGAWSRFTVRGIVWVYIFDNENWGQNPPQREVGFITVSCPDWKWRWLTTSSSEQNMHLWPWQPELVVNQPWIWPFGLNWKVLCALKAIYASFKIDFWFFFFAELEAGKCLFSLFFHVLFLEKETLLGFCWKTKRGDKSHFCFVFFFHGETRGVRLRTRSGDCLGSGTRGMSFLAAHLVRHIRGSQLAYPVSAILKNLLLTGLFFGCLSKPFWKFRYYPQPCNSTRCTLVLFSVVLFSVAWR